MNVKLRLSAIWFVLAALLACAPAAFAEDAVVPEPPYTIDYEKETLQFDDAKYTLADADGAALQDAEGNPLADGASLTEYIAVGEAKSLTLVEKADATKKVTVAIPARPAAPGLSPDWKAGTTLNIYYDNFYYWSTIDGSEGVTQPVRVQCHENRIPLVAVDKDTTLHVQSIAVNTDSDAHTTPTFASAVATLRVPALREAPDAEDVSILLPTTPDTITVKALEGAEYSAVPADANSTANAADWKSLAELTEGLPAGSNPILRGLTPDTDYTVKVRLAATGTPGQLPSAVLELDATTQKAGSLQIVPVDAEGKPFAGLAYSVWVPAPEDLAVGAPQDVTYTLDAGELTEKRGLIALLEDGTAATANPEHVVKLTLKTDGSVTAEPATWEIKTKPALDLTEEADKRTTAITFSAADSATLPGTTWTYTRVGDVPYSALPLPTGYRLPESLDPTTIALRLVYVGGIWKALPESGLTVPLERIATPVPPTPVQPTPVPATTNNSHDSNDDSTPAPTAVPTEAPKAAPTAAPTVVPVPAPAPAPVADPTAGRLMPGSSANRNQQSTDGTTFTAKPDSSADPGATPSASPTPSPKPTPTATAQPTATPAEDATPEDGTTEGSTAGKTPLWLNVALLALGGGGLYALWFVMFHLPKKRAAEMDLFKSRKKETKREDDDE